MSFDEQSSNATRRDVLQSGGVLAGATAFASLAPHVYAQNSDPTVKLALIGCGGRGGGAVVNALTVQTKDQPVKLHAMADVFESNLENKHKMLSNPKGRPGIAENVDVTPDRKFIGFDGYKHAIDSLDPGDVAIFTTPCAFRWVHYAYAIEKGVNVFMEKPVCPDGPTARRMLELNQKAIAKNLKVGVGLMCRHCVARGELAQRVKDGAIGDIINMRAYRMQTPIASCFSTPNPGGMSDLMYQIKRFHSFLWLSGGSFSDFFIHNIDECCWIKDAWPVEAQASGGRHYRGNFIDQNLDSYSVEYTFGDGSKLYLNGRNIHGCKNQFASYAHGSNGSAVISESGHAPSRARIYKGQVLHRRSTRRGRDGQQREEHPDLVWAYPQEPREPNPYELEWTNLLNAIKNDEKYNEVERGVKASVVTSMGRMAAHTGQVVTFDEMLNHEHDMGANAENLTLESESPLKANEDGSYPVPEIGRKKTREY